MSRFAEQAGIGTRSADIELDIATIRFCDAGDRRRAAADRRARRLRPRAQLRRAAGEYRDRLGPGASVRDAAAAYLDDNGLTGAARRRARFAIRLFSEQEENIYWNRISLDYAANYASPYDGVGQGDFPDGRLRRPDRGDGGIRARSASVDR